jgi:predicted Fe-S protein YdhL (DUF1289 family)
MSRNRNVAAHSAQLLGTLLLVGAAWASQADAQQYVVLSLIGDHITIVGEGPQTGSRLDQNRYQVIKQVDPQFDDFAVSIADAVLAKAEPTASVVTLRVNDPKLYALRDSWLDTEAVGARELLDLIGNGIPPAPDSHLLLITSSLRQPDMRTGHGYRGTGKVAGLGFYLDTLTMIRRSDTQESSRGYLGVFANFQLVLVNLQTNAIEGRERIALGTTRSSARAEDRTSWNALTPEQKSQVLQSLIKKGIEGSLPRMLSSKKQ